MLMLLSGKIKGVTMVVASVDPSGEFYSFADLLANKDLVSKFPNLLLTSGELEVPYLVDETSLAFNQVFDIFLNKRDVINDTVLSSIKGTLDSRIVLPLEIYQKLFKCTLDLEDYISGEYNVNIDFPVAKYNNFGTTKKLVDALNAKNGFRTVSTNNTTLFRNTPDDELFVALPSVDSFSFSSPSDFIPSLSKVFIPYKDDRLKSVNYKNFLATSGTDITEVEGSSDNVTSELYDEEKRFYDALCSLHKGLLKAEYPDVPLEECILHKTSSSAFRQFIIEFILRVVSYHWNHKGFLPLNYDVDVDGDDEDGESNVSSDSLSSNKLFSATLSDLSDGESILTAVINKEFTKDIFFPINILIQCLRFGKKKPSKLKLFDDKSYFNLDTFAYTTISGSYNSYEPKLTPSGCLYTPYVIVKADNRIVDERFISNFGIENPILEVPVGLVCKKEFQGTDEYQLCIMSFVDIIKNYNSDKNLSIEGVEVSGDRIVFNSNFPKNLYEPQNIKTINEVVSTFRNSSDGFFISYVSPSVKEAFMNFTCYSNKLSSLGIFNDFIERADLTKQESLICLSEEELKQKSTQYRMAPSILLNLTLGLSYCKLISKVNDRFSDLQNEKLDYDLNDIVSLYLSEMKNQDFYGDVFYTDSLIMGQSLGNLKDASVFGSQPSAVQQASVQQQAPVQHSAPQYSQQEQVVQQPAQQQAPIPSGGVTQSTSANPFSVLFEEKEFNNVINVVMTDAEIQRVNQALETAKSSIRVKVLGRVNNNAIVGYLGVDENKINYFLEPSERSVQGKQNYSLFKFKPNMVALLRILVNNRPVKVKFSNEEVFNYYASIVEKI